MCTCSSVRKELFFSVKSRDRPVFLIYYHLYKLSREYKRKNINTFACIF